MAKPQSERRPDVGADVVDVGAGRLRSSGSVGSGHRGAVFLTALDRLLQAPEEL
jgi:hypothetical protein